MVLWLEQMDPCSFCNYGMYAKIDLNKNLCFCGLWLYKSIKCQDIVQKIQCHWLRETQGEHWSERKIFLYENY